MGITENALLDALPMRKRLDDLIDATSLRDDDYTRLREEKEEPAIKIRKLNDFREELELPETELRDQREDLLKCRKEWHDKIKLIENEAQKTNELTIFENYWIKEGGIDESLRKAKQLTDRIKVRRATIQDVIKELRKQHRREAYEELERSQRLGSEASSGEDAEDEYDISRRLSRRSTRVLHTSAAGENNPERDRAARETKHIALTKIQPPKFDGSKAHFFEWHDLYVKTVEARLETPHDKMAYLRMSLNEDVAKRIAQFAATEKGYEAAMKQLRKVFGNRYKNTKEAYAEFRQMKLKSTEAAEVTKFVCDLVGLQTRLEALGIDSNHPDRVYAILDMLPEAVLVIIEREKTQDDWTNEALITALERYSEARDTAAHSKAEFDKPTKKEHKQRHRNKSHEHRHSSRKASDDHPARHTGTFTVGVQSKCNEQAPRGNDSAQNKAKNDKRGQRTSPNEQAGSGMRTNFKCVYCAGSHMSEKCQQYSTLRARTNRLLELKACFHCLKIGHSAKECRRTFMCMHCRKRPSDHHHSLCPSLFETKDQQRKETTCLVSYTEKAQPRNSKSKEELRENVQASAPHDSAKKQEWQGERHMRTARTSVINPRTGKKMMATLIFDSGSLRSFVSEDMKRLLQLPSNRKEVLLVDAFNSKELVRRATKMVQFDIELANGEVVGMEANSVSHIARRMERELPKSDIIKLREYDPKLLADPTVIEQEAFLPDILIGLDYYNAFMLDEPRIRLPEGSELIASRLGLLVSAPSKVLISRKKDTGKASTAVYMAHIQGATDTCEDETFPDLRPFWSLESIGITEPEATKDDDQSVRLFNESVMFQDGRYHVKLPFASEHPTLPDNFALALGRFRSQARRLRKDKTLLEKYDAIIQEQLQRGIIEPVDYTRPTPNLTHYIPHHAVITPQKSTTKVRIVYDASAKASQDLKSLNECLLSGPNMLPDLVGLLLRFRETPIAVVADVEKAFLQVGVQECHRDVLRFFWYQDPTQAAVDGNLAVYRFTRVPFGVKSSPFLLNATVKHHLQKVGTPAALELRSNIYVDNALIGAWDPQEAMEKYHRYKETFGEAAMNLREWTSNSAEVNRQLPDADASRAAEQKFLGIHWNTALDTLQIAYKSGKFAKVEASTKRMIAQQVPSVYDPIGLLSPVTLPGKLIIQQLWKDKLKWDEAISEELKAKWRITSDSLAKLNSIKVPRYVGTIKDAKVQLHAFVDASKSAYGVAVYIRTPVKEGGYQAHLVYAKARPAPLKAMSIPRLELTAMLIGTRALDFVKEHISSKVDSCTLWSDSQCCLQWLKTSKSLQVFVHNRVSEIKKADLKTAYVSTKDNPADVASRGCTADELATMPKWWHGPEWLIKNEEHWPKQPAILDSEAMSEEAQGELRKKQEVVAVHLVDGKPEKPLIDATRFSSFTRLRRVTVYVWRFLKRIGSDRLKTSLATKFPEFGKLQTDTGEPITGAEMAAAEQYWIMELQKTYYQEALEACEKKKHALVQSLGLKKDAHGLLRCHGRYKNAELPPNAKMPALLPPKAHVTKLIIRGTHLKQQHAGVAQTLATLRLNYWMPRGRNQVVQTLRSCVNCQKHGGGPYKMAPIPPLPVERIQDAKPFKYTGLDIFGHLWYKTEDGKRAKCWVALFTCFVTRAVHLELITGMTSQHVLNALRRFISRRGTPTKIISDNAPQFKLVDKTQQDVYAFSLFHDDVFNYVANEKIEWKFITEYAPWEGGLYERLVGVTKQSLKKAVGRLLLSFDQLRTYVTEAEAVVNSRPLTYMTEQDGMRAIRPIDFQLYHGHLNTPTLADGEEDPKDQLYQPKLDTHQKLLEYWKNSQRALNNFKRCWNQDYLLSLRERTVKHREGRTSVEKQPEVGDVVLIYEENAPRNQWCMGRVENVVHGSDGAIRSADVKLSNRTTVRRSIKHLYPLEVSEAMVKKDIKKNDGQGQKKGETQSGYYTRSKAKRQQPQPTPTTTLFSKIAALTTVLLVMNCFASCTANKCSEKGSYTVIDAENCTSKGVVVYRSDKDQLCWKDVACATGHLQTNGTCGAKCDCPRWATACSHYEGKPTVEGDQDTILQGAYPNICSMEKDSRCDDKPTHTKLNSILLYDGTTHYVQELKIEATQPADHMYTCVGSGKTATGSSLYCQKHECVDKATKFCYYKSQEIVYFVSSDGKLPIRAWGAQEVSYYGAKGTNPTTPTCNHCMISCVKGGVRVQLDAEIDQIEICTVPYCYRISNPKADEEVPLPPDVNLHDHEVTMRIWANGALIKEIGTSCKSNPYCEQINCYFCRPRIYNPHCAPKETYLVIFLMFSFSAVSLYLIKNMAKAIAKVLAYGIRGMCWIGYRCIQRKREERSEDLLPRINPVARQSRRHKRSTYGKIASTLFILALTCVQPVDGCSDVTTITAPRAVCNNLANGTTECVITEATRLSLVPQGQESCLLIKDVNGEPMGTLSLQVKKIEVVCTPKNEYFTRSFTMKTEAVKRCSGAGSCYDGMELACKRVASDPKIDEFSDLANNSPGHTYCGESCGCAACGCFHCTPACLFYRNYAEPTSDTIHEIFTCPTWLYSVQVVPKLTLRNKTTSHNFTLSPGIAKTWSNIRFTLNSISNPPTPLLNKKLITDGVHTAIVDASSSGQPVVGTIGQLQCGNRKAAENFDCYLPKESCQCNQQGVNVGCICSEQIVEETYTIKEQILPLTTQGLTITMEGSQVVAEYSHIASLEVQISMEGVKLVLVADKNTCTIKPIRFAGCYNCYTGAKLDFECKTDFGDTLAHVTCGTGVFSTRCSAQGVTGHAVIAFATAKMSENCTVTCPAGSTTFPLEGTLYFVDKRQIGHTSNTVAGKTLPSDLNQFWNFIQDTVAGNWLFALLLIIPIIPLLIIAISCGPTIALSCVSIITHLRTKWKSLRAHKEI